MKHSLISNNLKQADETEFQQLQNKSAQLLMQLFAVSLYLKFLKIVTSRLTFSRLKCRWDLETLLKFPNVTAFQA